MRTNFIQSLGTVAVLGATLCPLPAPAAATVDYAIAFDAAVTVVTVRICPGTTRPLSLTLSSEVEQGAISAIQAVSGDGLRQALVLENRRINLDPARVECVAYEVDLAAAPTGGYRGGIRRYGDTVLVALNQLLMFPATAAAEDRLRIRVTAPRGSSASFPGRVTTNSDGEVSFELLSRSRAWDGRVALGRLRQSVIDAGHSRIRVSMLGTVTDAQADEITMWLRSGVAALGTLYGRLPLEEVQIIVVPVGPSDDPVPWGEVMRGGGDAVHLYVDHTRDAVELIDNWVLIHELSHLLHPYIRNRDGWLPEGIASYYQNVLRARAGLISKETAWKKLTAGFSRGLKQTTARHILRDDTRELMGRHQYMRVYWSGAAIALIGDVELRLASDGRHSLDSVFETLSQCCLPTRASWTGLELLAQMDEISGLDVFVPLYRRYVEQPVFPDVATTLASIGIDYRPGGVVFVADQTGLRDAIMTAPIRTAGFPAPRGWPASALE
jgi:hypothetical protein